MIRIDAIRNFGSDTVNITVKNEDMHKRSAEVRVEYDGRLVDSPVLAPGEVKHIAVRITAMPSE